MRGLYYRPRVGLIDTAPAVDRMLTEGYRRMPPGRKLAQASALTRGVFAAAFAAFRARHADLSDQDVALLWCRQRYGDDLARRVAAYLEARQAKV